MPPKKPGAAAAGAASGPAIGNAAEASRICGAAAPQDGGTDNPPTNPDSPIPAATPAWPTPAEPRAPATESDEPTRAPSPPSSPGDTADAFAAESDDTNGPSAVATSGKMVNKVPVAENSTPGDNTKKPETSSNNVWNVSSALLTPPGNDPKES